MCARFRSRTVGSCSWVLVLRGALRRLRELLIGHPLLRWRYDRLKADRLVIAPQELRTADATRASEIYSGRFAFAGKVVVCDRRSLFEMDAAVRGMGVSLLSFAWLRHLRAAESGITRANARALVDEWMTLQGCWHPLGWRVDVLSRRIISWLSQAPLVLQDADVRFYRRFLRSLVRQVRYLRRTSGMPADGFAAAAGDIALTYAALCIAGQARYIKSRDRAAEQRDRAADPARRRSCQPRSRRDDRTAAGPLAAAPVVLVPQHPAAPAAAQRHRPHDADAAFLPAFGRHFCALQRHGGDAGRSAAHADGL